MRDEEVALRVQLSAREAPNDPISNLVRRLLSDLDALRRLPVIAACGECGWHVDGWRKGVPALWCEQQSNAAPQKPMRPVDGAGPPDWCPLRGTP
jgi:hypothetical protein